VFFFFLFHIGIRESFIASLFEHRNIRNKKKAEMWLIGCLYKSLLTWENNKKNAMVFDFSSLEHNKMTFHYIDSSTKQST
jgi:hypothetical protein